MRLHVIALLLIAAALGPASAKDRDEPKFPVFTAPKAPPAASAAQPEPRAVSRGKVKRQKARAAR